MRIPKTAAYTAPGRSVSERMKSHLARRLTLCLLCSVSTAAIAHPEDIADDITTPVTTATLVSSGPSNILITNTGSITSDKTAGFVAVTVDSSNNVTNEGEITITDGDDMTGILIEPGFNGTITNSGTIFVGESYVRTDDDDDDDLDGPLAEGESRHGIWLSNGGALIGDILSDTSSTITVEGNNSSGIRLDSYLDGSVGLDGTISVVGDEAQGVSVQDGISGDFLISGTVQAVGTGAVALDIRNDVGGNFTLESSVLSTGFASTSLSNYITPANTDDDTAALEDRIDAEDLNDNLATVAIGGSLGNGFLINGAVDDFTSEEDTDDETKDTTDDFDENRTTGTVSSYGSGPAVLISADWGTEQTGDLIIGKVVETVRDTTDDDDDDDVSETLTEFTYDQGVINRGSILAYGQNVGFDATGLRIEGEQAGDAKTIITNGMLNTGTITSRAYEADAVSVSLGRNADVGTLQNDGTISATIYTTDNNNATAVSIAEGATLNNLINTGTISTSSVGRSGDSISILDQSGTLTKITNNGLIVASQSTDGLTVTDYGVTTAIDLSGHDATSSVSLIQTYATPKDDTNDDDEIDIYDVTSPYIIGDVLLGAGDDQFDLMAGYVTGDVNFGSGDATFKLDNADLTGDVLFSSGTHDFSASGAEIEGNVTYGNSVGQFSLADNSDFSGQLITENALLDVSVADSVFRLESGNRSSLETLLVTGNTEFVFVIDPDDTTGAILEVADTAYIGANVVIKPVLTSLPDSYVTQSLISAADLTFEGDFSDVLLSDIPFLYSTSLMLNDADIDTLDLVFVLKSTEELGLDTNQSAAFDSLISVFSSDDELGSAVAALSEAKDFYQVYDMLLPQRTDASTRYLKAQANASFGALNQALDLISSEDEGRNRVWLEEYFVNVEEDAQTGSPGYNGDGFGLSAGMDAAFGDLDALGLMISFATGDFEEKTGGNNPVTTTSIGLGVYAEEQLGPIDLRAVGMASKVNFASHRDIVFSDTYEQDLSAEWNGWSNSASLSASSRLYAGKFFIHPKTSLDWFSLSQDGYTETGGDGLLEAEVSDASTDSLSISAILGLGADFEFSEGLFRSELQAGVRSVLSSTPYTATVSYLGSDDSFSLLAPDASQDAAILGLTLTGGSDRASFNFSYNMEQTDTGTTQYAGGALRLKF